MLRRALALAVLPALGCERAVSFGELVDGAPGALPFRCDGEGPLHRVGDGAPGACGADSQGFHYALCSCDAFQNDERTQSDGFDSRIGPYAPGAPGGSLGVNGALYLASPAQIGGSLHIAGQAGAPLEAELAVAGNLLDQGPLFAPVAVSVGGDARIGGDVRVAQLSVAGTLTLAEGAALEVPEGAPSAQRAPVMVAPPCRCDDALDLGRAIDAASADNDDAALGLDPRDGLKALNAPLTVELPCGRYSLSEIYAAHALTVRIRGRVALFVQTKVVIESVASLTVELDPGAELDLVVRQGISASGPVEISGAAPTRTRLYLGGPDTLYFGAMAALSASLYAPRSELVTKARFELFGAALVRRVAAADLVSLHYDRALDRDACEAATCAAQSCGELLRCEGTQCLP